jgi:hypothetical protein
MTVRNRTSTHLYPKPEDQRQTKHYSSDVHFLFLLNFPKIDKKRVKQKKGKTESFAFRHHTGTKNSSLSLGVPVPRTMECMRGV